MSSCTKNLKSFFNCSNHSVWKPFNSSICFTKASFTKLFISVRELTSDSRLSTSARRRLQLSSKTVARESVFRSILCVGTGLLSCALTEAVSGSNERSTSWDSFPTSFWMGRSRVEGSDSFSAIGTPSVKGLDSFAWAVVRIGTTRDFGCGGGFVAYPVSVGRLVTVPAVAELREFWLADVARGAFLVDKGCKKLDVKGLLSFGWGAVRIGITREFGCSGGFAASLVSVPGIGILSACIEPKEICLTAVLGCAFFVGTGLPKLEHEAGRFREVGTSVATAFSDDAARFWETETSVAAASAVLTLSLGLLGIGIVSIGVEGEGVSLTVLSRTNFTFWTGRSTLQDGAARFADLAMSIATALPGLTVFSECRFEFVPGSTETCCVGRTMSSVAALIEVESRHCDEPSRVVCDYPTNFHTSSDSNMLSKLPSS